MFADVQVEAAEELFEVLTHPSIAKRRVPILLACNKMDLETQAHSIDFVRRTLEKQVWTSWKSCRLHACMSMHACRCLYSCS